MSGTCHVSSLWWNVQCEKCNVPKHFAPNWHWLELALSDHTDLTELRLCRPYAPLRWLCSYSAVPDWFWSKPYGPYANLVDISKLAWVITSAQVSQRPQTLWLFSGKLKWLRGRLIKCEGRQSNPVTMPRFSQKWPVLQFPNSIPRMIVHNYHNEPWWHDGMKW